MKVLWKTTLPALFLLITQAGFSQDSAFSFNAYIDTYYCYDASKPVDPNDPSNQAGRVQRRYVTQYDKHNVFGINHAILQAQYEKDRVRSEVAIQAGTFPINNYGHEPNPLYQIIHRANVGYQVTENSWVDVGVLGGHFGYESVLAIDRKLLSPALATEYTPYYQTGLQYTWSPTKSTEVRGVVVNGWQIIAETDRFKSVGLAIDQKIGEAFKISYGNYFGKHKEALFWSYLNAKRHHHNLFFEFDKNDWAIAAIGDYTWQKSEDTGSGDIETKTASFFTLICAYDLSEKLSLAGRYEYVEDKDELLINSVNPAFKMNVISLTLDFRSQENVSFKFEPKIYSGENQNFVSEDGYGRGAVVWCGGLAVRLK